MNEILLEYYTGKPKELIRCEGYLSDIIKDIKRDHQDLMPTRSRHVYRGAESVTNLENSLADYFKVDKVCIYWKAESVNAATRPPFAVIIPFYKYKYLSGDKIPLKIHIFIDENLVYKANLNEAELLAVILHEIGHNFYYCPLTIACEVFCAVATLPFGPINRLVRRGIKLIGDVVLDAIKQYIPFVFNIMNSLYDIKNEFAYFVLLPSAMKTIVAGTIFNNNILLRALSLPVYGNEKGADSFAVKYGYGPEQASALHKMSLPENMLAMKIYNEAGPVGTVLNDITLLSIDLIAGMMLDPNPNNNQRAASMLKKLEADLKRGEYPPEMREDLENEIKRMRKAYESINDPKRGQDPAVRKTWYGIIDHITKGHSDFREIFNFYYDSFKF